jgi:hypothetical protein
MGSSPVSTTTVPDSIFDGRYVVDQHEQVVAGGVDGLRELDLRAAGCRPCSFYSWSERISRLFNGVRSSLRHVGGTRTCSRR